MTQQDLTIIDKHLKGINIRLIWALVICTSVSVTTVVSVYYGFKTDQIIMRLQISILEKRVDRLEASKNIVYDIDSQKNMAVQNVRYTSNSSGMRMVCLSQD